MYKYLYIYNYSDNEQDLCEMEFRIIFNQLMSSKYHLSNHLFDYTRSPFIRARLDIISSSTEFNDIVEYLNKAQLCYYNFKVIYLKNDITHVAYKESLERCKALAYPINGSVNMQKPETIFAVTNINNVWYFGILNENKVWRDHFDKPYSYSHSLNMKDARTIVNMAVGNEKDLKVIDPCCGIGTVVLEALSMGINIKGIDINRDVSYQARLNLEHFGYDPLIIEKKDMRELTEYYDVAIMDIPYGVYSPFTYNDQLELLEGAYRISDKLLLVSHIDMRKELKDIGYEIIDCSSIIKGTFKRYMTLCKKVV